MPRYDDFDEEQIRRDEEEQRQREYDEERREEKEEAARQQMYDDDAAEEERQRQNDDEDEQRERHLRRQREANPDSDLSAKDSVAPTDTQQPNFWRRYRKTIWGAGLVAASRCVSGTGGSIGPLLAERGHSKT